MDYTLEQLRALPTIKSGPVNDLKVDTGRFRVWVRRDEGPPAIGFYGWRDNKWHRLGMYRDRLPPACWRLLERSRTQNLIT